MSATNNAVAYERALSYQQKLNAEPGGWRFGMKLTTENVWDSFVLWVLLKLHYRQHRNVVVPHHGLQKDRFTALMKERNNEVINEGQDEIAHYCDKCLRVYEDEDGNLRKWLFGLRCRR